MYESLGLSLQAVANVEFQRAFFCLVDNVSFPSSFIMKNMLLKRKAEVISLLLKYLPDDETKVSLAMDCWSFYNRQGYMAIVAYFLDAQLKYHQVLLAFEHVPGHHTDERLAKILHDVVKTHSIESRIMAITANSAKNNDTMHVCLVDMLKTNSRYGHLYFEIFEHRVSCLAYVIQLVVKELLGKIRLSSRDEFQTI